MVVKQYPHTLVIPGIAGESTQNEDGTWSTTEPTPPVNQSCRYEAAGRQNQIKGADGEIYTYTGIVYMPLSAPDIANTIEVTVTGRITAKVIYFYRGQLNCTMYL